MPSSDTNGLDSALVNQSDIRSPVPLAPPRESISGVVNAYARVTEIAGDSLRLGGSTKAFRPGDRVLVLQMAGALIDTSDTEKFGTITAHNGAGRYRWATVVGVSGQDVKISPEDLSGFDARNGKVQLVRAFSRAGDIAVTGRMDAPEWNGASGGVIAIESSGTIEIAADVDASAKGFWGGTASDGGNQVSQVGYTYVAVAGQGYKGEGIAAVALDRIGGRGAPANGGGGGNESNAGGGGGGNGGGGGRGAGEREQVPGSEANGGLGGCGLDFADRVFMGGGGGGGQQNNGQGSTGGSGGGIVFLRAPAITGAAGARVRANGGHGGAAGGDGAGGGGAGGTVLLDTASLQGAFTLEAKGGSGGDCADLHGAGGGGGGGTIRTNAVIPSTVTTSVAGGNDGLAGGRPRGAASGEEGILAGFVVPIRPTSSPRETPFEVAEQKLAEHEAWLEGIDEELAEQAKAIAEIRAAAAKCGDCTAKLAALGEENMELSARVAELEKKLEAALKPAPAKPAKPVKPGNLQIVEGIGAGIEDLLKKEGIVTLKQLASTSVKRLKEILAAGGKRFGMADPSSWPEQAGLAAEGEMEKLEALQDRLDGGRYT